MSTDCVSEHLTDNYLLVREGKAMESVPAGWKKLKKVAPSKFEQEF